MHNIKKLFVMTMFVLPFLFSCCKTDNLDNFTKDEIMLDENGGHTAPLDTFNDYKPYGDYVEGNILIKYSGKDIETKLNDIDYVSVDINSTNWYLLKLTNQDETIETVKKLRLTNSFEVVDYDYIMGNDGSVDANADYNKQYYLEKLNVPETRDYIESLGLNPGGSKDVVVAVIDTGVDLTHIDLRDNIWRNVDEIPGNGIDDDGNGYIDDVNGWNFVANSNNPTDDNGHGTHVSGIIGAQNNDFGTVGIANNVQIMPLKAGNSSGYFNNSDIAEAITYAYMNGASVINMSFGGEAITLEVEDALRAAYTDCVLVASAGNDSKCNNLEHEYEHPPVNNGTYPAALPYVIGVMSTNQSLTEKSYFSNYDDTPNNNVEYEVYAPGENIISTFPNNKTLSMSGTSMAAPIVSGVAALLRSTYPDRNTYSNKYLQSQIVNTGSDFYSHKLINPVNAFTVPPTPSVSLYDYYIFDNVEFDSMNGINNGDGIIDAGETIRIGIELSNKGGRASNVKASIDVARLGDDLKESYVAFRKSVLEMGDIGTYAIQDGNLIYDEDNNVVGVENYFEILITSDCPNDYLMDLNLSIEYQNGLDENDKTVYNNSNSDTLQISISSGEILPSIINEDTIFKGDKRYIVSKDLTITENATVTFEAGAEIQFYGNYNGYEDILYISPAIYVYGNLNFEGTKEKNILIKPSELYYEYACLIYCINETSLINYNYCEIYNLMTVPIQPLSSIFYNQIVSHSTLTLDSTKYIYNGKERLGASLGLQLLENSILTSFGDPYYYFEIESINNSLVVIKSTITYDFAITKAAKNNFFFNYTGEFDFKCRTYTSGYKIDLNNNVFYSCNEFTNIRQIYFNGANLSSNLLLGTYDSHRTSLIGNYYDSSGNPIFDEETNDKTFDATQVYPFITNIEVSNDNNNYSFNVTFSKPMNNDIEFNLLFGTMEPYADYRIMGEFISSTEWVGTYKINSMIDDGINYFSIEGGESIEGETLIDTAGMFNFKIDTSSALAMNLFTDSTEEGIVLTWNQDEYDTLMGYNIYRSDTKDGNYVKINTSVVPSDTNTYLDKTAEPGKSYWYTFTVVLTDFTESNPAGRAKGTMIDSVFPNIYHTPVNQGYLGNNLTVTCKASDNINVESVILYYRKVGQDTYKSLVMNKQNDLYSATIYGSELTLDGLEYYIEVSDGTNSVYTGSYENPYRVIIKDSSTIALKGDVDGDGIITTKDALMILKHINEEIILTDDEFIRADLNNDNTLSTSEALRILQYINGKVNTLEM